MTGGNLGTRPAGAVELYPQRLLEVSQMLNEQVDRAPVKRVKDSCRRMARQLAAASSR